MNNDYKGGVFYGKIWVYPGIYKRAESGTTVDCNGRMWDSAEKHTLFGRLNLSPGDFNLSKSRKMYKQCVDNDNIISVIYIVCNGGVE